MLVQIKLLGFLFGGGNVGECNFLTLSSS